MLKDAVQKGRNLHMDDVLHEDSLRELIKKCEEGGLPFYHLVDEHMVVEGFAFQDPVVAPPADDGTPNIMMSDVVFNIFSPRSGYPKMSSWTSIGAGRLLKPILTCAIRAEVVVVNIMYFFIELYLIPNPNCSIFNTNQDKHTFDWECRCLLDLYPELKDKVGMCLYFYLFTDEP